MSGYQTDSSGTSWSRSRKTPQVTTSSRRPAYCSCPVLVFDSRAYAHVLRPLAEAGYLVAVLKEPFGFSLLDADQGKKVLDVHPEITYWAAGGHSLGGTTAASLADQDERVKGLVLFASYPADSLVRTDLKAVSISGAADGFTTPADIEASKGGFRQIRPMS